MSGTPPSSRTDLSKIVERQMRNWELARSQRLEAHPTPDEREDVAQFITVSRSVGSGGSHIATLLGQRLNWPVFDREILQAMAGDDAVRTRLYEQMDERDVGWLEDAVRWLVRGEFRKDDYFYRLSETVLAIAHQGNAVFLGRAVDMILPAERGLRVRVVAPISARVTEVSSRLGVSEALAMAEIERVDRERDDFRRRHFGREANASTKYDLVINYDRFTPEQAVDVILAAAGARGVV
jgi:cytidylate kinase